MHVASMISVMVGLEITPAGLINLAGDFDTKAASITAAIPPSVPGGNFQPSATAARAIHADVAATGAQLASLLKGHAGRLVQNAGDFVTTDQAGAAKMNAAGSQFRIHEV